LTCCFVVLTRKTFKILKIFDGTLVHLFVALEHGLHFVLGSVLTAVQHQRYRGENDSHEVDCVFEIGHKGEPSTQGVQLFRHYSDLDLTHHQDAEETQLDEQSTAAIVEEQVRAAEKQKEEIERLKAKYNGCRDLLGYVVEEEEEG
jgi:hypothetical protein